MEEKNAWEIDRLNEKMEDVETKLEKHDEKLGDYERFKATTVEQLVTIFKQIDKFDNTNKWIVRTFITTLSGGVVTLVITVIKWFIEN